MHAAADRPTLRTLQALRTIATAAVRAVAALIARRHQRATPGRVRRKGEGDFVTASDLRAERQLRRRLRAALPTAGFLGEETGSVDLGRDFVWVVDPIDGTSNFANGLPQFAVAVALLHRRQPVLASMWCAPEGALYEAIAGHGAFRDGRRLRLRAGRWDDRSIVGCQWHRGQQDLRFLARLQQGGCRIRTFGCTVVQLCDVAMGRLDANVQQQGRIWDFAAPGLLLQEAGGRLTDWQGRAVFPLSSLDLGHVATVAASAPVHRRILQRLRRR